MLASGGLINSTKGSQLPSFSQPSEMSDGQISNTCKLSHLGLYASKTIGSLRPTAKSSSPWLSQPLSRSSGESRKLTVLPPLLGEVPSKARRWGLRCSWLLPTNLLY